MFEVHPWCFEQRYSTEMNGWIVKNKDFCMYIDLKNCFPSQFVLENEEGILQYLNECTLQFSLHKRTDFAGFHFITRKVLSFT